MGGGKLKNADILRQKAEELLNNRLKGNRQDADSSGSETHELTQTNALKLVHELEVRQIELELMLEMMTEELSLEKIEKAKRAIELVISQEELAFQNQEKTKRSDELGIANIELAFQNEEKSKRAAELIVANKELLFQNDEKTQRAEELILANIELLFQNKEKENRAAELAVANQLISSQRDRLDEIANLVPGVVFQYRLHPDGTSCFPYASEAIRQIYRVTPEEVREDATNVFANIHPDDCDGVVASIQKSAKELTLLQQEYRVKFDDGTIRTHFANAHPRLEVGGSVLWHGFITDITWHKEAENELRESEERFRNLAEHSRVITWECDSKGLYTYISRVCTKVLGYQPETIIGKKHFYDFHPEQGREEFKAAAFEVFSRKESFVDLENELETIDNQIVWISTNGIPILDPLGILTGYRGSDMDITLRKHGEEELKKLSTRLTLATHSGGVGVWDYDLVNDILVWDDQMFALYGIKEADFSGVYQAWRAGLHPEDVEQGDAEFEMAIRGEKEFDSEFRVVWPDGSVHYIRAFAIVQRDNFGKPVNIIGTNWDITAQKDAEKALLDSQARYSSMISNNSDVIGIMGADGIMKYKSPNIEKFFGWLPEERVGMSVFSMIHPDDMEYAQKVFNSLLGEDNSVKTLEFRYECKDSSYKPIELTAANLLNDPVIDGILLNYRDISGRKAKEEEKLKADITIRILSLAINQSPVTVVITDLAGNIESVNSRFTDVTGYTAEEVIGQNMKILKAGDRPDSDYKELWNTILSGGNWHGIFHNRKKNGELYWESAVISPVKDQHGIITHFLAVKEDITSRLKSEQEIKHKNEELQKLNSEKDKFFSIIAHDLRGPLGGFKGLTEMMADESNEFTGHEIKEMTLELSRSARNTFNLLENLLEWSQMDSGLTEFKPQKLGLMNMVTDCINVVSEQARGKGIALNVELPTGYEVIADKNMLQTVIRNLLSNAIKFTPKGGSVAISAKPAENSRMVISVKDTGIGMNDEMQNNLFNLGANTKRPGTEGEKSTGLGLLLCKEFVEKNGGEIRIESEQNHGTIFSFTIPTTGQKGSEKADLNAEFTEKSEGNINNLKILIAEDDDISAKLIHMMVKGFSREVFEAKTGRDAVHICLENPDIDLVMMDIAMPFMDGYEATRQIRQFNQKVIIIAQTTFVFSADRENAFEAGCNDYITKPFGKAALVELIKKHIKK